MDPPPPVYSKQRRQKVFLDETELFSCRFVPCRLRAMVSSSSIQPLGGGGVRALFLFRRKGQDPPLLVSTENGAMVSSIVRPRRRQHVFQEEACRFRLRQNLFLEETEHVLGGERVRVGDCSGSANAVYIFTGGGRRPAPDGGRNHGSGCVGVRVKQQPGWREQVSFMGTVTLLAHRGSRASPVTGFGFRVYRNPQPVTGFSA